MKTTLKKLTPMMMGVLLMTSSCGQTSSQTSSGDKHTCTASCAPGCVGEKEHSCTAACGSDCKHKKSDVKSKNNKTMETEMGQTLNLEPLFRAELEYDNSVKVNIPQGSQVGDHIGNGRGTLTGKINGEILWQFYAENCAYLWIKDGKEPPANQHLCKTNPGGIIKTSDGAEIKFDAKGYGFKGFDKENPHLWNLTCALQFHTEDERYLWLNTALGVWEGQFNEKENLAIYNAYIQH